MRGEPDAALTDGARVRRLLRGTDRALLREAQVRARHVQCARLRACAPATHVEHAPATHVEHARNVRRSCAPDARLTRVRTAHRRTSTLTLARCGADANAPTPAPHPRRVRARCGAQAHVLLARLHGPRHVRHGLLLVPSRVGGHRLRAALRAALSQGQPLARGGAGGRGAPLTRPAEAAEPGGGLAVACVRLRHALAVHHPQPAVSHQRRNWPAPHLQRRQPVTLPRGIALCHGARAARMATRFAAAHA